MAPPARSRSDSQALSRPAASVSLLISMEDSIRSLITTASAPLAPSFAAAKLLFATCYFAMAFPELSFHHHSLFPNLKDHKSVVGCPVTLAHQNLRSFTITGR